MITANSSLARGYGTRTKGGRGGTVATSHKHLHRCPATPTPSHSSTATPPPHTHNHSDVGCTRTMPAHMRPSMNGMKEYGLGSFPRSLLVSGSCSRNLLGSKAMALSPHSPVSWCRAYRGRPTWTQGATGGGVAQCGAGHWNASAGSCSRRGQTAAGTVTQNHPPWSTGQQPQGPRTPQPPQAALLWR
jgi:hypothetical protein